MSVLAGRGDGVEVRSARASRRRTSWRARLHRDWQLLVLTAPAVLLLLVFHYLPLLGNIIAFQDYSPFVGIAGSPCVGLDNFQRLFTDPDFWHALLNTLRSRAFQLVFFFPVPIALALLLNSVMIQRVRSLVQGSSTCPTSSPGCWSSRSSSRCSAGPACSARCCGSTGCNRSTS